jgi:hypothetical protein
MLELVERRSRADTRAVAFVALALVAAALLWFGAGPKGHLHNGDTDNLVAGARTAAHCVRDGVLTECGLVDGSHYSYVFPYPLLQYLPALGLIAVGASDTTAVEALGRLSLVALAATVALTVVGLRRSRACAVVGVAALLASSALYQSTAAFGEMLAATVVLAAVVAAIRRRPWLLAAACVFATLGKETLAPFVFLLVVLAARRREDGWLPERRLLAGAVAGVGTGVVATLAFNVFRFGTLRNSFYLDPVFRTPGVSRKLEYLLGVWLSPSAGIAFFWPITTAVLVLTTTVAVRRAVGDPSDVRAWGPPAALIGGVLLFTAGLAAWLSPFGWIAYGPRLAVPILPAATVLALHLERDTVERLAGALHGRRLLTLGVALAFLAVGWPQFGSPWSYRAALAQLTAGDSVCPPMIDTPVQKDKAEYHRCISHVMWRTNSLTLDDAATDGGSGANAARGVAVLACGVMVLPERRRVA